MKLDGDEAEERSGRPVHHPRGPHHRRWRHDDRLVERRGRHRTAHSACHADPPGERSEASRRRSVLHHETTDRAALLLCRGGKYACAASGSTLPQNAHVVSWDITARKSPSDRRGIGKITKTASPTSVTRETVIASIALPATDRVGQALQWERLVRFSSRAVGLQEEVEAHSLAPSSAAGSELSARAQSVRRHAPKPSSVA